MSYDGYDHMVWDAYYIFDDEKKQLQRVKRKDVGYSAIQYVYGEQGKRESKQYLDEDGNLVMHKENGYAECRWFYNEMGQLEYIQYLDENQEPINKPEGYAKKEYIYNAGGNNVDWIWYDSSGNEVMRKYTPFW
jgi:hypothetical protein|nr:hypothetical protein [uncultured Acetatifactor sp.]